MSAFTTSVESFITAIRGEQAWVEELNEHSRKIAQLDSSATLAELNDALRRLATLFPDIPLVALGEVAITCGSLVECGGDPNIAGMQLLERLMRVNETAIDFYQRCRRMAESDAELVEELRGAAAEDADDDVVAADLTAAEIVEAHVGIEDWRILARRFRRVLFESHPAAVLGQMAEHSFRLGLIAHLSRSKALRSRARAQAEYLEQSLQADAAASASPSFLAMMLQVLDDESLLVIHVQQGKGFDVRISGIADNFQLHTLLAGALIGPPSEGFLTGDPPSQLAVAQSRDQPVGDAGGDSVTGSFNLWNWTGLQPDGHLPDATTARSGHWIWNEGCPADIAVFEGRRVVLLGPPPYARGWRAGRAFSGMPGELTVERILPDAEAAAWLERLGRSVEA